MRTIRGRVAVAGVGETTYYKHGQAPESRVQARAAGDPRAPARTPASTRARSTASRPTATTATSPRGWPPRSACPSCASPTCSGAAAAAAARRRSATRRRRSPPATPTASSSSARWPRASSSASAPAPPAATVSRRGRRSPSPTALISPAQRFAMRVMRFMHDHGIAPRGAARHRAGLLPPRAGQPARGDARPAAHARRPTTPRAGSSSRSGSSTAAWRTTAPPRSILVSAERARDLRQRPAYLLGVAQGSEYRNARARPQRAALRHSSFTTVAPHLYEMAGVGPKDVARGAELRELHRRRADEPGRARLLRRRGGQRLPRRSRT